MATVPSLPSTGQPIDTQYIYDIVSSLISINTELSTSGNSYVDNGTTSTIAKTGNLKITAKTVSNLRISNGKVYNVGDTDGTTISFDSGLVFTKAPVVIANLVSTQVKPGTGQFILTISSITQSGFNWNVYCTSKGPANYNISFIAIGV
jgi:hypothetical protein